MRFFIASRWKNKDDVKHLGDELIRRNYEVYSFLESGANLATGISIEEELKSFHDALSNWQNDPNIRHIFNSELENLKRSDVVIMLQPAGHSASIEVGIGYGLGKRVVIIGQVENPEVFYLICDRLYPDVDSFIRDVDSMYGSAAAAPPTPTV